MLQVFVGGVLALPPILWLVLTAPLVAFLSLPAILVLRFSKPRPKVPPSQQCAFITGGSQGLGLGVAKDCVRRGMSRVVILARDVEKLNIAKEELEQVKKESNQTSTVIEAVPVDIADYAALEKVAKELHEKDVKDDGHATYLFQCAGFSYPGYFSEIPISEFERQVKVNQLGSIYVVRAFLPYIQRGHICLTSSIAGLFGVFGLSAYCPTKFAIRGFAEVLHIELATKPITVQVAYPPDMDTPGYQEENKTKPKECFYISAQGSMFKPDDIGKLVVKEALQPNPKFASYFNIDGWLAANMTAGMSPMTQIGDGLAQLALPAVLRIAGLFFLNDWWAMVRRFEKERTTANTTAAGNYNEILEWRKSEKAETRITD